MKKFILSFLLLTTLYYLDAQTIIQGSVFDKNEILPFASITIKGTKIGTVADQKGYYQLKTKKEGKIVLIASFMGYLSDQKTMNIAKNSKKITVDFNLTKHTEVLDQITITGTRTDKRRTNNPVIVNVINSEMLSNVQACTLSEGLRFQSGLRVETDCQTCNYTQLRINGLKGGYSQILINGQPTFSPLTGLYGLEQIPANMIDRIEVVRGAGSALYGSGAIGGTVNVITKVPKKNNVSIGYTYQNIKGTNDHIVQGNATFINEYKNSGASFFVNNRERGFYDANNDNFSEIPHIKNTSFGINLFFLPTDEQKIEINFSKINEYRYGGEIFDKPAYLALQSEERIHDVYMGNINYKIDFNEGESSLITYLSGQYTSRNHYTGIFPDNNPEQPNAVLNHVKNPPYGTSKTTTLQAGIQYNHKIEHFFNGINSITIGTEFVEDDVLDQIKSYRYKVDQLTKNIGFFFQSDWEITQKINLLSGFRVDKHNMVSNIIINPRISLLYKPIDNTQIRANFGTGFRAPQAFDTDLHIAFSGGGVSRVSLLKNLKEERSTTYDVSFNYDKPSKNYIYGFTIQGFYTHLKNAFFLKNIGTDNFGELFEKQNSNGAVVKGITIEARFNYNQIFQVQTGVTFQSSIFDNAVKNSDVLPAKKEFLRAPNNYGYATLTYSPNQKFKTSLSIVYTGKMEILHLASARNLLKDQYFTSPLFTELAIKSSYIFDVKKLNKQLEVFGGVKNIFNAYQTHFDIGKERDSNFIYGPSTPRTIFIGLKIGTKL